MTRLFSLLTIFLALGLQAQNWETDLDSAKNIAFEKNENIILVFQGSDWCAPCIKLDRNVWSTTEFKEYALDHYVMLQADFPRKSQNALSEDQQKKNNKLAEKYNSNGIFPLVVILDNQGKVLGETGYKNSTPSEYIAELNKF